MEKEELPIVLSSNDNYVQALGVTIFSLLANFHSEKYQPNITILDGGISKINKNKLRSITEKFSVNLNFILITNDNFIGFPILKRLSVVTYYRLLIPDHFKNKSEKVLYLDSDILVLENVVDLFNEDIGDNYVAAIRDFSEEAILKSDLAIYKNIKKYFNAGILVLNIKKMNNNNFYSKCLEFIKNYPEQTSYCDQDILNFICVDKWKELNIKWNVQLQSHSTKSINTPNILHFAGPYKPWNVLYTNFYHAQYMYYLRTTWPKYKISLGPIIMTLKSMLKLMPFFNALLRIYKKRLKIVGRTDQKYFKD